jgi:hypothetical protein
MQALSPAGDLWLIMFGLGGNPSKPYGIESYSLANPDVPSPLSFLGAPTLPWFNTEALKITGTTLFAVATSNSSLNALDISNPSAPATILGGNLALGGTPFDLALNPSGTIAIVAETTGAGLRVVDISNPSAMSILASVPNSYFGVDTTLWPLVVVTSNTAPGQIRVYDLTIPAAPTLVGSLNLSTAVRRLVVDEDTQIAYVAVNGGQVIYVVDLTTPTAPVLLATIPCSIAGDDTPLHLSTYGGRKILFAPLNSQSFNPGRIQTFDVTVPSNPTFLRGVDMGQIIYDLSPVGDRVYVSNRGGAQEIFTLPIESLI